MFKKEIIILENNNFFGFDTLLAYQQHFMLLALEQASKAYKKGEIPVGVVIVKNGKLIAKAFNTRNKTKNAVFHAEVKAIIKACKKLKDWRLNGCDLFVTLLPCPMCAGAIVNSRISRVFYGASNNGEDLFKRILKENELNHKTEVYGDVLPRQASDMLKKFFKERR